MFIFQVGGALAFGANTTMTLINGAQAKNVFWQVLGAATFGASNEFVGTLIASDAIGAGAGTTVNGHLLSLTGAITMSSTQLYSAPPPVFVEGGPTAYTTSSTPLITGVTSVRSPMTVTVTIDGVDQTPTVTPSATGVWSYQASALLNGVHNVVASTVAGVGNVGSYSQILTVDTTPPSVSIDGGEIAITNDLTPTIHGVTDIAAGQVVTLTSTRPGPPVTLTRTALVQADQSWSISPNGFTAGVWSILAHVADPAGNASTDTQTLIIDTTPPTAAITSSALTDDSTPTITGTTEADAIVAVSIDGLALTDIVQGSTWAATTTVVLSYGNHTVSVTATDRAGNIGTTTQTLTINAVVARSSFVSLTPARVLDTRSGAKVGNAAGTGAPFVLQVAGQNGVPASGVGAVALNVTVVAGENPTLGGGYVTVYPCGTRPGASNLNFTTGQTIPNSVIAPLSASGTVCFYVYGTAHLLADVSGYFPA